MGLDKKLQKQFRRKYGMDLLPVSYEDIFLGDIIEWDGKLSRKKIDFENFSLIQQLKIDSEKKNELETKLAAVKLKNAAFQKITIERESDLNAKLDIPNFASNIDLKLGMQNILNFQMEDVKCKVLERDLKVEIRNLINNAKETDKKHYRKKLKRLFFIDKLFYAGNVMLEIKQDTTIDIEAALSKAKILNPNIKTNTKGTINVSFAGSTEIPFAADIEPLKDFID